MHERRMKMQEEWEASITPLEYVGDITAEELEKHKTRDSCWIVYNGFVYDITSYLRMHPGGTNCLLDPNRRDVTGMWNAVHRHVSPKLIEKLKIGKLV